MKYLYSWLKQFYPQLPDLSHVADILARLGYPCEAVDVITYPGVIVAGIKSLSVHPRISHLQVATIADGRGTRRVVCGAPDLEAKKKVVYAPPGTSLPSGRVVRQALIGGEISEGMLLAEDELGCGVGHETLLFLPSRARVGAPAASYLPPDGILDCEITQSRGDVLSHFGLARDLAAALENQRLRPKFKTPKYAGTTEGEITQVHRDAQALSLGLATNPDPSLATPIFLASRLGALGQKPINLATDLTNYLMLEYGQPLHAYDADRLPGWRFSVRRAREGEGFAGLDGVNYTLTPQAIVIAADDKPLALAGILGGITSKVTAATRRILFESGHFYPRPVRLMARGLGITTESSFRFERGVDPQLRQAVLSHLQAWFSTLTGGKVYQPLGRENSPLPPPRPTELNLPALNRFLGRSIPKSQLKPLMTSLGVKISSEKKEAMALSPPSWRSDLAIPEDYYEEIVRVIGLETMPKKALPASVPQWRRSKYWRVEALKDKLVTLGAHEVSTYPFLSRRELALAGESGEAVELAKAALEDKSWLRPTLIPGLLAAVAANPETPQVVLYEVALIHTSQGESESLAILAAGHNQGELDDWWRNCFERLHLPVASWMARLKVIPGEARRFSKIRKPIVLALEQPVGAFFVGRLYDSPTVIIPDLEAITYTPGSKFPISRRDVACVVAKTVPPGEIIELLQSLDEAIVDVELFDTYNDPKLGKDYHSLAFRILYQAPDHTLTSAEVKALHRKVTHCLEERFHGTIR